LTWDQNRDGLPIVDYSSQNVGNDEKNIKGERAIMLKALMGLECYMFLEYYIIYGCTGVPHL
jgi:hypothetical protein